MQSVDTLLTGYCFIDMHYVCIHGLLATTSNEGICLDIFYKGLSILNYGLKFPATPQCANKLLTVTCGQHQQENYIFNIFISVILKISKTR